MVVFLKLDERLQFYQEVIETLFYGRTDFEERLRFIQSHKLPSSLVAISSQLHIVLAQSQQLEHFDYQVEETNILMRPFDIEGFFDAWDVLLILTYIQHVCSNAGFLGGFNEFEPSNIINAVAKKLYCVQEELEKSFGYLKSDMRKIDSNHQHENDLQGAYEKFAYDYLKECHDEQNGKRVRRSVLQDIKKLYRSLPSIDGGEFGNMYEFLGFIMYHGSGHSLYQMTLDQLERDIYDRFHKLSFKDKISALDEVSGCIEDIDVSMIENLSEFKELVLKSNKLANVIYSIKEDFLAEVPKYQGNYQDR